MILELLLILLIAYIFLNKQEKKENIKTGFPEEGKQIRRQYSSEEKSKFPFKSYNVSTPIERVDQSVLQNVYNRDTLKVNHPWMHCNFCAGSSPNRPCLDGVNKMTCGQYGNELAKEMDGLKNIVELKTKGEDDLYEN